MIVESWTFSKMLKQRGFEVIRVWSGGKNGKRYVQGYTENKNDNDNGTGFVSEDDELDKIN